MPTRTLGANGLEVSAIGFGIADSGPNTLNSKPDPGSNVAATGCDSP